jgi:hypothetical protein
MEVWEWQVAAAVILAPFLVFGVIELFIHRKRKREQALASRPKVRG